MIDKDQPDESSIYSMPSIKHPDAPLVSIIMPVRNGASFLEECIHSIISQSYPHWELLITDDHSTDDTPSIIKKMAQRDSRIRLFNNPGRGIIPALKYGYHHARGEYIHRMDADDLMPPQKLALMAHRLAKEKSPCVVTGYIEYIKKGGLGQGYKKYRAWLNQRVDHQDHYAHIYKECVIPSPCWMIRKSDFDRIGGFDSEDYPEDYDLCFRMYRHHIKVIGIPKTLHIWRDHDQRASRNDPHYSDQSFVSIKVKYFLLTDRNQAKPLILWGAGKKGKNIAKHLITTGKSFEWVTNNPLKAGKNIYGIVLQSTEQLSSDHLLESQLIIAVAGPNDKHDIRQTVKNAGKNDKEVYWFC